MKYEYVVLGQAHTPNGQHEHDFLQQEGNSEWELCAVLERPDGEVIYYFKRAKQ